MKKNQILRVDLSSMSHTYETVPEKYQFLGGRGLTSRMLSDEVDPKTYALNPDNKIIIAPGLLNGTSAPSSGRISVGAKSPLTGGIKESNAGGTAGQYLAGLGIKALVIEGKAVEKHSWVLVVDEDNVDFVAMDELAGLGNYELIPVLKERFGATSSIISVGPAAEAGSTIATLAFTDLEDRPARHAARGGLGAVAAAKGIKAIVIAKPEKNGIAAVHPNEFRDTAKSFAKELIAGKKALTNYGTAVLVNVVNNAGGLPNNNFSIGQTDRAESISGEKLNELCNSRGGTTGHPCSRGCVIRCSNVFHDKKGQYLTAGLEYETIALLGSNCGVYDLDQIAEMDRICDNLGIDTIDAGGALGVAMEAGMLEFGDFEGMKQTLLDIPVKDQYLSRYVAHGAAMTGRMLGVERVPVVKNQTIAAYDPRSLKGTGVTYATTPMGGDHTAGNALPGRGGVDCSKPEGQTGLSKSLQLNSMICDTIGVCIFVGPMDENLPTFASLVSAHTGKLVTPEELTHQASETLNAEIAFNRLAGISDEANDLPSYFRNEALPNNGLVFDVPADELKTFSF